MATPAVSVDEQGLDLDELEGSGAAGVACEALSYYQQRARPQRGLVLDINATDDRRLDLVLAAIAELDVSQ